MPKFLTTTGVSHEIENIIKGAKNKLALVSPYLKLSQNFYERLRDADKKNVAILIVYGKEELNNDQKKQLAELQNLKLYFCENLHAKCYMNENSCVITSMNMYEFSEKNNREIGVLFSKNEDYSIFMETAEEIKSIIDNSKVSGIGEIKQSKNNKSTPPGQQTIKSNIPEPKIVAKNIVQEPQIPLKQFASSFFGGIMNAANNLIKTEGSCIRCGTNVSFDLDKPLCVDCFKQWAIYGNPDYPENFCVSCGKKRKTSFAKPQCRDCYNS